MRTITFNKSHYVESNNIFVIKSKHMYEKCWVDGKWKVFDIPSHHCETILGLCWGCFTVA